LKRVQISGHNSETIEGFANEIQLLQKFQGSDRIISLKDSEIDRLNERISIVLELGDIDLRTLIEKRRNTNEEIDPNCLRIMWQQMLESVQTAHDANVFHGDLKPANFLFVGDRLKLIDFGIAKSVPTDDSTTSVERTFQCGTLSYMPPEALRKNEERDKYKVGRPHDVWSLGCILYQLLYNRPAFPQTDMVRKVQAIASEDYAIEFPEVPEHPDYCDLIDVIQRCLQRNPKARPTIDELLDHKYIRFHDMSLGTLEQELLSCVVAIQDDSGQCDFDSPEGNKVLARFAESLKRAVTIRSTPV
jgi:serine/threonine-protein kinase TTK/MPS1